METVLIHSFLALQALAMALRPERTLRWVLLASQVVACVAGVLTQDNVLLAWSVVLILINGARLIHTSPALDNAKLAPNERLIHQGTFSVLSPQEFRTLWRAGNIRSIKDEYLIHQGTHQHYLTYIIDGEFLVSNEEKNITTLTPGDFTAEISFLTQDVASADVKAIGECTIISWDQQWVSELQERNPNMHAKIHGLLCLDLANKLRKASEYQSIDK